MPSCLFCIIANASSISSKPNSVASGSDVLLGDLRDVSRAPRRGLLGRARRRARRRRACLSRTCSSKASSATTAPTPASARPGRPRRCQDSGDGEARAGCAAAGPVVGGRRLPSPVAWPGSAPGLGPRPRWQAPRRSASAGRRLLGEVRHQPIGLDGLRVRSARKAQSSPLAVVGRRSAARRVEQERVAVRPRSDRVVADSGQSPAGPRAGLPVEPVPHVVAVGDAVAVGDDQRRPSSASASRRPSASAGGSAPIATRAT